MHLYFKCKKTNKKNIYLIFYEIYLKDMPYIIYHDDDYYYDIINFLFIFFFLIID